MLIGIVAMVGAAAMFRDAERLALDKPASIEHAPFSTSAFAHDVLALQMEDHYVRVHRASGSELVLLTLGRAIERVDTKGLRTHRSWWVADHAVASVEGNARSMRLRLTNGVIVPVARSAVAQLRSAGWIGDARANTVHKALFEKHRQQRL
jgi:DNA-binding LytR/AlgR family response regulator